MNSEPSSARTSWLNRTSLGIGLTSLFSDWRLEDSLAAGLVAQEHHDMAFGMLAAVNAGGDFASSFVIGLLWSTASTSLAFGLSGVLFLLGFVLILRIR